MKKILLSIAILGVVGVVIVGATIAIFSDTEVSTGNTFTAGEIDLTIDNESYYNGVFNEGTSWFLKDLEDEDWFFYFEDLKPGDWGEDTISLHVKNNDSWLCADITLTSNKDNGYTEPEFNDEEEELGDWTAGRGELADSIYFIWWADDGDNVLEVGEQVISGGPIAIGDLSIEETLTLPLADSETNIWNVDMVGGPLPGDSTRYIGKAWCFGNMTLGPLTQDAVGYDPNVHAPIVRGAGFSCDGSQENNSTQTDSVMGDVSFRAEQSRHQNNFVCKPETQPTTAVLTVDKMVAFSGLETDVDVGDFELRVTGPGGYNEIVIDEIPEAGLVPGAYNVTEKYIGVDTINYAAVYGIDCDVNGNVTLLAGDNLTCRIINTIDEDY